MQELAAELAEADSPTAHLLEVRDVPVASRLRSRAFHRALPTPAGVALAVAIGRLMWRLWPDARMQSRAWARAVLGPGAPDPVVGRLGRAYLLERTASSELAWRPWLGRSMALDGLEHLEEARRDGRGTIVASPHFGPFMLIVHALCARGLRPYVISGSPRSGPVEGRLGAWVEFQRRTREAAGGRTICTGHSFDVSRALLERGETVVMLWDVPGTQEVELLGRTAYVRSGPARLAEAAGATIVPAIAWRERSRPFARFDPPIDASDGRDAVMGALAAHLDRALRTRLPQAQGVLARLFR